MKYFTHIPNSFHRLTNRGRLVVSVFALLLACSMLLAMGIPTNRSAAEKMGQQVTISKAVWYDANVNGIQDAGEQGIANVRVDLLNDKGDQIDSVMTDPAGKFTFRMSTNNSYIIKLHESNFQAGKALAGTWPTIENARLIDAGIDLSKGQINPSALMARTGLMIQADLRKASWSMTNMSFGMVRESGIGPMKRDMKQIVADGPGLDSGTYEDGEDNEGDNSSIRSRLRADDSYVVGDIYRIWWQVRGFITLFKDMPRVSTEAARVYNGIAVGFHMPPGLKDIRLHGNGWRCSEGWPSRTYYCFYMRLAADAAGWTLPRIWLRGEFTDRATPRYTYSVALFLPGNLQPIATTTRTETVAPAN